MVFFDLRRVRGPLEDYVEVCLKDEPIHVEWVAVTDFSEAPVLRLLQHTHRPGVHGEMATEGGY